MLGIGIPSIMKELGGFVPSDVPQAEADALITLYDNGGGDNWTTNTGWKVDPVVGNWYGVTVVDGNVDTISLLSNGGVGDISSFDPSAFSSLDTLRLTDSDLSGDLSGWEFPAPLSELDLSGNSFPGDLSGWDLPSSLVDLRLDNNSFSGDISGWVLPSSLESILLHNNSFSGDLSSWEIPPEVEDLYLQNCAFSGSPGWVAGSLFMLDYRIDDNFLSQDDVDAILEGIYDRRNDFNSPASLNVAGDNSAPSGTYQDEDPPATGNGYAYELENDPEAEGFNTWTITRST